MLDTLGILPLEHIFLTCSHRWKRRGLLKFGVEDGYSTAGLATYIAIHKTNALSVPTENVNWYLNNAAHASVTGVGLLLLFETRNLDIPINIINLVVTDLSLTSDVQADVTKVLIRHGHFTIKTGFMRQHEFKADTHRHAQRWKKEIEQRVGQSKLRRRDILEEDKYKESYAHFKDLTAGSAHSSFSNSGIIGFIASDEEGVVKED